MTIPIRGTKKWIDNNIKDSNIHFLLFKEMKAVAYLNLIDIQVDIDNMKNEAFGVGNVCTIEKGKGYGQEIMIQINQYIIEKERIGLLFCKEKLVDFYKRFDWFVVEKQKLVLAFNNSKIYTLVYNQTKTITNLQYNGKSF